MAWYKSGSVTVTNGNATVYGNGTLWVDVSILYSGDVWVGPDGRLYEIASIQSNTQLTLASAYLGATANTQAYAVMPIGLLPSALAQQVKATLSTANTALSQAVRFDANQNLTSGQKATARSNIGATAAADVGLGLLSKSVAGGVDVTLSTDEAANLFYEFTGALTANINVVVPGNVRQFFVRNNTTGAFTLTVKTLSGTGIKVLQGTRIHLECDGTNVLEPTSEGGVITVDASGNVGVGTGTPAQALDVRNATGGNISAGRTANVGANSEPGTYLVTAPNSNGNSRTWASLRTLVVTPTEGAEASALALHTQSGGALTETMRLDSTTNVGIGTTAPRKKLDVNGAANVGGAAGVGYINFSNTTTNDVVAVGCAVTTGYGDSIGMAVQNATGVLTLATNSTERVRVNSTGAVGIAGAAKGGAGGFNFLELGSSSWMNQASTGNSYYGRNWYYNGVYKYKTANRALLYVQDDSGHSWHVSPIGTVDGTVTFTQAMTLDPSGNLGIGTGAPTEKLHVAGKLRIDSPGSWFTFGSGGSSTSVGTFYRGGTTTAAGYIGTDGGGITSGGSGTNFGLRSEADLILMAGASERARIDSSGNLLVGAATAITATQDVGLFNRSQNDVSRVVINNQSTGAAAQSMLDLEAYGAAWRIAVPSSSNNTNPLVITTTGASGGEKMRITYDGNLLVGVASGAFHVINKAVAEGTAIIEFDAAGAGGAGSTSLQLRAVSVFGANSANAAGLFGKNATTGRSVNAGGTINASGADYAEYMTKADDCGTLAKGQIVGIDMQGKLTDKWANAVSFLVKSTDPSLVGGDVWGTVEMIGAERPTTPIYVAPAYMGPEEPEIPVDYDSESFRNAPVVRPQPADVGMLEDDADAEAVQIHEAAHAQYLADMEVYVAAKAELDQYNAEHFAYQVDRTARIEAYNEAKAAYDAAWAQHQAAVEIAKQTFDNVTMPAYEQDLATFEATLEEARQKVDRIAYCGQVPVNVQGAEPGQFVVPVQDGDGIGGQLVDDDAVTFAQYRRAVGIVQNILADGRANIRVKVV